QAQTHIVPLSPAQRYRQDLDSGLILPDAAQAQAIAALDDIYLQLVNKWRAPASRWQALKLRLGLRASDVSCKGLYLWGGVGRGKTCLMDLFFHALPGSRK